MSNEHTIEQKNEAIAIFERWKIIKGDPDHVCLSCDKGTQPSGWCTCDQKISRFQKEGKMVDRTYFQYHSSWDWLKPVIDLISKMITSDSFFDSQLLKESGCDKIMHLTIHATIETAYEEVYQFIQWYNNQSTTTNDTTTGNK